MKHVKRWLIRGLVIAGAVLFLGACGSQGGKVTIASKQFTENILLSEIYAQLIEYETELEVERKQNLGGTSVCFPAMEKGEVDIYVEYSGTAYNEILKLSDSTGMSADEIYDISVKKLNDDHDITMFQPIGINNTFAVGMLRSKSEELGVTSISDLSKQSDELRFGANHVFYTRDADGYDPMVKLYDLHFSESLKMDTSLLYDAINQNKLDVMIVYATDSLLKKYDMVILQDDKELFPPYHGSPICRNDTLEKYPELNDVLDLLKGRIDDVKMQELDYEIDVKNKTPEEVAEKFLADEGLVK